jgi:hypothetical protein
MPGRLLPDAGPVTLEFFRTGAAPERVVCEDGETARDIALGILNALADLRDGDVLRVTKAPNGLPEVSRGSQWAS